MYEIIGTHTIAHIVWAQKLGYTLEIRPIADGVPRLRRAESVSPRLPGSLSFSMASVSRS